ncbi:LTA synthase family protein [Nitrospira sp. Nam74]
MSSALGTPTVNLVVKTFAAGFWQDFRASMMELGGVALLAILVSVCVLPFSRARTLAAAGTVYIKSFTASLSAMAICLLVLMTIDLGYYRFSHHHLDFVFFEYVDDLWHVAGEGTRGSQAVQQTTGELQEAKRWGLLVSGFLLLEAIGILGWWTFFHRHVRHASPFIVKGIFGAVLVIGVIGSSSPNISSLHWVGPPAYFTIAENPILSLKGPLRDAVFHQWKWVPRLSPDVVSLEEALSLSQRYFDHHAEFSNPVYPFARAAAGPSTFRVREPMNVLIIFVEGLDRRYLNRTVAFDHPVRVTPFLDKLKQDSLYFDNFFANGVQTSRGLLATMCSYFPRHGAAAIKTRSSQDFLCLPSVLREMGYRSEMVVGQGGSINNLRRFFTRNGIDHFYDINDFPAQAERMGLGVTDSAIFDFIQQRLREGQNLGQPVFLATLTLSMHHPFIFPVNHPDVQALKRGTDPYLAALRYFDVEFERFVTELQREGLLKNTLMIVLGDHGRHESLEPNDEEQRVGHFLAPLFIWVDEAWRNQEGVQPRAIGTIASQVDVAPTVLSIIGLSRPIAPFVGHDLSCLLVRDCLENNTAYLTSVYDDLIGLVSREGILLYSFPKEMFDRTDLAGHLKDGMSCKAAAKSSDCRTLLGLYLASNILLEENRIWFRERIMLPHNDPAVAVGFSSK